MNKTDKIWMNGKLINWDSAKLHFLTQGLHYGAGVFEGIRCYETEKGPAVFRLREHVQRLFRSARVLHMKIPFSQKEIIEAITDTVRVNKVKEAYIRPCVYVGYGAMGLDISKSKIDVGIAVWPWGAYLGEDGIINGIRCCTSTFSRHNVNPMIHGAKISGIYFNSILAKMEALRAKYDEAILLDDKGFVSEGSGENLFMIKRKKLYTAPLDLVLEGITRDSIITIAKDLGYPTIEQKFKLPRLLQADELFFTGTAAEVTPIREVNDKSIGKGKPGQITKAIQEIYFQTIHGKNRRYRRWLHFID